MTTKARILETLRDHSAEMSARFGVRRLGLFGSYARGEQSEGSDVDVLAEFERPLGLRFIDFTVYLESLLGEKVDVLTPAGLEAIRNPQIAEKIRQTTVYA